MNLVLATLSLLVCQFFVSEVQGIADGKIKVASLPDGYVPHNDIGFAYKVHSEDVSWTRASELCKLEGAELAAIDTNKKLEYAENTTLANDQLRHVGIHWVDEDWVTVTNQTIRSSIPWSAGEPGPRDNGFDCVMVGWKKLKFNGLMNGRCDTFLGEYICQIPLPESA